MANKREQDIDLDITRFEYGDAGRPQRAVLTICTEKGYDGGLRSEATVYWVGNHCRSNMMTIGGSAGGDFRKNLKRTERTVKATQKNIDAQHAEVFTAEVVAALTEAAKAHYAGYVAAGVDGMKNTYPQPVAAAL